MNNDIINGLFEFTSAIFCSINVVQLIKDKKIMGVSWVPTMFFTLWGLWNIYYYPSLGQMYSLIGGVSIVTVNTLWLILVWKYSKK